MFDYNQAFSRNAGLIGEVEQQTLRKATIAIPGLGGVGGQHLITLARLGVGGFRIADADRFEAANLNRQFGAFQSTLGSPKAAVMERFLKDVNPEVRVRTFDAFIDAGNVEAFLDGCDLVIDGIDAYAIDARRLVFKEAHKHGIPVITAGPLGFSASMLIFLPGGMGVDEYFDINDGTPERDKFLQFIAGLCPEAKFLRYMNAAKENKDERRGPSVASAMALCAGFAATEAVKIILKRGKVYGVPYYHYYDAYLGCFKRGRLPGGNCHPFQKIKIFVMKKYLASKQRRSAS